MQSGDEGQAKWETEQRTPQEQAVFLWMHIQQKLAELSVYLEVHPEVKLLLDKEEDDTDKPNG